MSALVLAVPLPLTVDVERLFMLLKPNAQIYDGWLLLGRGNIVCTKPENLEAMWSRKLHEITLLSITGCDDAMIS